MSDFIESINSGFRSRLKNPILGGFIFSWIVINWRPILYVILSDEPVVEKFTYIDHHYVNLYNLFWWPLVTSLGIFIMLPYLMAILDYLTIRGRIIRKKHKSVEVENDLDLEISRVDKMHKLEDAKAKYTDREELNRNIEELKAQLISKDLQNDHNESFRKEYMNLFKEILSLSVTLTALADNFLTSEELDFSGLPGESRDPFFQELAEFSDYLNVYKTTPELREKAQDFLNKNKNFLKVAIDKNLIIFKNGSINNSAHYSMLSNWEMSPLGIKTLIMYQNELAKRFLYLHLNRDKEVNPSQSDTKLINE